MGCPLPDFASQSLNVQFNQTVDVRGEYLSSATSGTFYHCLGFQQNGMIFNLTYELF